MAIRNRNAFFAALLLRLFCLLVVNSYFVPDEYWQSLEIAHRTVFGYGYVTWEWEKAIRSFFYPFWFALVYKILEIFSLDYVEMLILVPRLLQAIFSAIADLYFWLWLNKSSLKYRKKQMLWTYVMWTMCLFVNYCSTRTLTNTAELNFSTIALYYYPWDIRHSNQRIHFLWFVGLACLSRPTAAVQWLPLCVYDIVSNPKPVKYCITVYCSIALKVLFFSILIDVLFYKRIVLTSLQFILYNGQYNVGIHYGVHSWFWYITVGIPVVLGPIFVLFYFASVKIVKYTLLQVYRKIVDDKVYLHDSCSRNEILLFFTILWTIFCYSLVPHKEFRFIIPLVPVMLYFTSISLKFNKSPMRRKTNKELIIIFISIITVILNFFGLIYLGLWHQVGPLEVISKLAYISKNSPGSYSFLFLTSCHATPLYSHLHVNVTTQFITCEPNLKSEFAYKDESDIFFENPIKWLDDNIASRDSCALPTHIIFFENLKESIKPFLDHYNYTKLDSIFNSHFPQGKQSQYFEVFHLFKDNVCFT